MRRVVVTGLGLITALGTGLEKSWEEIIAGKTGVKTIESFNTEDTPVKVAGEVRDFDPLDFGIEKKELKKLARNTQFAIAASKMAVSDAELKIDETNANRVGVIVSSGIGGMEVFGNQYENMMNKGTKKLSPFTIPAMTANMAAGNVGIYLGAKGPNKSVVTACASGTHSIGDAFETIKLGRADVMIAGGTEAAITRFSINSFANMKALSMNTDPNTASRPFTINRDGFVMGEGAGVLVLEELEHALKRGAKIYAEMVGYGESCDAYHITAPVIDGAVRAFKMALEEGKISIDTVDYINAHGTSTGLNDKNETAAIKEVFEENAFKLNISSTKGATGHALGGAGGIEGVILAKSIFEEIIPPTVNYDDPDPECDLDYTPNKAIQKKIRCGMSSSLGFGGHNAVIAMKRYDGR